VQQVLRAAAEEVVHSRGKYEAAHDVVDAMTRAVNQLSGEIAALTGAKPPVTA